FSGELVHLWTCYSQLKPLHLLISIRDAHPTTLPPFPTRRSSDLLEPAAALEVDHRRHDGRRERVREPVHRERRDRRRDVGEPFGDRKSTRLNSSHGSISYAVFCLKKKKSLGCRQRVETKSNNADS